MGKSLQFELWKECNNNCSFCYSGKKNLYTSEEKKIKNLQNAINRISNLEIYEEYDTIGFIGGEFFQGQLNTPEVKDLFFSLINKVNELSDLGYIKCIWLNATLTIGKQDDLYTVLDILKNCKAELWILTSYDTLGRFHTKKMEENWSYHMKNIHNLYPNVNLNTTIILTGDFINKYLNNEFDLKYFRKTYNTSFFMKSCAKLSEEAITKEEMNNKIGNFFPTRHEFLKFLKKIKKEDKELYDKLFNIKYRADDLIIEYQDQNIFTHRDKKTQWETFDENRHHLMKCGHVSMYQGYIDCDNCVICDKDFIDSLDE